MFTNFKKKYIIKKLNFMVKKDMKIALGSDHGGFELKEKVKNYLENLGLEVLDFGTNSSDSVDYPVYAKKVCAEVLTENADFGILVCGTGLGMAICANKIKGIRAVTPENTFSAKMARAHNNANVLTLGQRVLGEELAYEIISAFLNTDYDGGRHQKRIDMFE